MLIYHYLYERVRRICLHTSPTPMSFYKGSTQEAIVVRILHSAFITAGLYREVLVAVFARGNLLGCCAAENTLNI